MAVIEFVRWRIPLVRVCVCVKVKMVLFNRGALETQAPGENKETRVDLASRERLVLQVKMGHLVLLESKVLRDLEAPQVPKDQREA